MAKRHPDSGTATALGVSAILIWASTIAFSRSLTEELGIFTSASLMLTIGGCAGMLQLLLQRRGLSRALRLPRRYLFGGGALFVGYMFCFYLAIGLSRTREQVVEVGILNYLWPSLTLVLAAMLLRRPVRLGLLLPGIAAACGGVVMALSSGGAVSLTGFVVHFQTNALPYGLAMAGAILWSLYSVFSRVWTKNEDGLATPLFLLAAAVTLFTLRLTVHEHAHWTPRVAAELLYTGICPTWLGYVFWDVAMRRGNVVLTASLSYFIPILSTAVSGFYLGVHLGMGLGVGCALVVAGALLCRRASAEIQPK